VTFRRVTRRVPGPTPADFEAPGLIIFDGDCGFCQASLTFLIRWSRRRPPSASWQSLDLSTFGMTAEECQQRMYFVTDRGVVYGGAAAVGAALRRTSLPWSVVGIVLALPGVRQVAELVYRSIARNRYRLPGASGACTLPRPGSKSG
jgi:predicted DCC family thiol-disulfide oxidoreductase YuxK